MAQTKTIPQSQVIDDIKNQVIPIFKRRGVIRASVFGSFARGEQAKNSDVDFLIEYDPDRKITLFDLSGLIEELKEALKRDVDVITQDGLSKYIRKNVLNDSLEIYREEK